jgi:hypothetical protein
MALLVAIAFGTILISLELDGPGGATWSFSLRQSPDLMGKTENWRNEINPGVTSL